MEFYQNLHEDNIRCDGKYRPKQKLIEVLSPLSATQIEKETGITYKTCKRLKAGKDTGAKTAIKLCKKYGLRVKSMFDYCDKKTLSERTIRNHMGIIYSILSTAVRWNVIKDNPMRRIDMKKVSKKKVNYYDDVQVANMLNALDSVPLMCKAMLYLAIDTGLRKGELTGLTWDDINFDYSQININKQRHYVLGYGVLNAKPKTEAGSRIVTVSQTVIDLLKQYRTQQLQQRLKLGTAWKNEPYVFLHDDGTPINPNYPYKWFVTFLEKHNLPRITFHQLRHTNATLLITSGEDIVTVSSRLGHADKSITLNTYSHAIRRRDVEIAKRMDDFYNNLKVGS